MLMAYLTILFLFLVSGAIALGYQVLWSKYLLDFIGVGSYSYATVLGTFMAGLAIGSWLLGKLADRTKSPLKLYAYLELGIGLYAILYNPLSAVAARLYANLVRFTPEQSGGSFGLGAKILVSALLLLIPTILMGGTFPALLRHTTQTLVSLGKKASQLYAINALGAVLGSLLMAFLLMPVFGMRASLLLLAVCNTVIAAFAFLLSGRDEFRSPNGMDVASEESPAISLKAEQIRLGYILIFIEGLLAFIYEIGWTRYFALTLGSSTYSFAIILAAFISGIAIGSAILSRIEKQISNPLAFFGFTQVLAGLWVIVSLPFYPFIPWLFSKFSEFLSFEKKAFYLNEFGKVILCFIIILPAAILIGMALPLVVKGLSRSVRRLGHDVGQIFAVNTWGNVQGALISGLLLLPLLGMELLLRVSAFCTLLLGTFTVVIYLERNIFKKRIAVPLAMCLIVSVCIPLFAGPWDPNWFTLFPFRRTPPTPGFTDARKFLSHQKILLFEDDPAANILVKDGQGTRSLLINGKTDASSTIDMSTQILLAQIPMLLHPEAKDVLVVGFASGVTSGSALCHPIERLDAVEIVRAMPEAARFFLHWNNNPFQDPRFHLIIDDARSYLSYTQHQYDVIISEPSNPWTAGTGSMFSTDLYAKTLEKLRPNGVFLQWIHSYELADETFSVVLHGFRKFFPYVCAFQNSGDVLLLGSKQPFHFDWNASSVRMNDRRVHQDLTRISISDLSTLLSTQVFSPETFTVVASLTNQENNDDNHLLEYRAPIDLFCKKRVTLLDTYDERPKASGSLLWWDYKLHFPENARLASLLKNTQGSNLLPPVLRRDYSLAYYYLNGSVLTPEALEILPEQVLIQKPLSDSDLAEIIGRFIQEKKERLAESVFQSASSALLVTCGFMREKSDFWKSKTNEWIKLPIGPQLKSEILKFRADLLMLRGESVEAIELMSNWIQNENPPSAQWAAIRAMQLKNQELLNLVLQKYSSSDADFVSSLTATLNSK
jgi:spermidine synthase